MWKFPEKQVKLAEHLTKDLNNQKRCQIRPKCFVACVAQVEMQEKALNHQASNAHEQNLCPKVPQ